MIEFIGDDDVADFTQRWEDRFIRVPATREGVRGFAAVKLGDACFERSVTIESTADESHTRGARAVLAKTRNARFDDFGMIRETEIVVRAETQHFAAIRKAHRTIHRTFDRLQSLHLTVVAQRVKDGLRARGKRAGVKRRHCSEHSKE